MLSRYIRVVPLLVALVVVTPRRVFPIPPSGERSAGIRVRSIGTVLMTGSDMDRSIDFYSRVLTFQRVSDTELTGNHVEHLCGLFGTRIRLVRMTLGEVD